MNSLHVMCSQISVYFLVEFCVRELSVALPDVAASIKYYHSRSLVRRFDKNVAISGEVFDGQPFSSRYVDLWAWQSINLTYS